MKHTRSIHLAALAAAFVTASAWGENSPAQSGSDSALRLLAAVGDGSEKKESLEKKQTDASSTAAADSAITSRPVQIERAQQASADRRDVVAPGTTGSVDQILKLATRAVNIIFTVGEAYDSNPRWQPSGLEKGEFVTWADLHFLLNPDVFNSGGHGLYYGLDVDSNLFSYSNSDRSPTGGRDQGEVDAKGFVGVRGAKTDVKFDGNYRLNNGSMFDFLNQDREAGRAQSNDVDLRLSGVRRFDHSQLNGYVLWGERNFSSDSGLNDFSQTAADVGWLYSPGYAPKTDVGAGFHVGSYDTQRNFQQSFYEPSFRFNYRLSPKTSLWGRVGYTFIDYGSEASAAEEGFASYAAGVRWAPSSKTWFDLSGSRDFRPALAYSNQDYFSNDIQFTYSQLLPAEWSLRSYISYDSAEYFSTIAAAMANREDEYWRMGADLSHPLSLFQRLNGQFSLFYYYNTNDSSLRQATFEQSFTGVKVGVTY